MRRRKGWLTAAAGPAPAIRLVSHARVSSFLALTAAGTVP